MKKLIALLLALMLALALAVPASAAGEDIGIIGGADGPTYILVSADPKAAAAGEDIGIIGGADGPPYILVRADPKAAATVSKEQREQNIKALGGVVGQVNVLLGDRCIAFTDAVPEVKNGRTMVPLRAALEAMGARIEFDQATKTAIVTGEKASFTHVVGSDVITRADGSTVKMDVHSYVTPLLLAGARLRRVLGQRLPHGVPARRGDLRGEGGQPSHHSQRLSGRKCEAL